MEFKNQAVGIGVVGYGYWGPKSRPKFRPTTKQLTLSKYAISMQQSLRLANVTIPASVLPTNFRTLLEDPQIDAIAIATPVHTHYELALSALRRENMSSSRSRLARLPPKRLSLIDEAQRRNLTLMVDHTFLYTPAVQKIRQLISEGALGDIYYYNGTRASLGFFQSDVNVIWDLAVHDISIIQYILK